MGNEGPQKWAATSQPTQAHFHRLGGLSRTVAWGEMSAPIFCLLFAEISTEPSIICFCSKQFSGGANAMPAFSRKQAAWSLEGMNTSGSSRAHHRPGYFPAFGSGTRGTDGTSSHRAVGSSHPVGPSHGCALQRMVTPDLSHHTHKEKLDKGQTHVPRLDCKPKL